MRSAEEEPEKPSAEEELESFGTEFPFGVVGRSVGSRSATLEVPEPMFVTVSNGLLHSAHRWDGALG
jgi:hypothetical protein